MKPFRYCADTQTIIYAVQNSSPQLNTWMNTHKPSLTDVSRQEAIDAFKHHIAKRKAIDASDEEINRKELELFYLEDLFRKAIAEGRYINTSTDIEIQARAKKLNENGVTPTVRQNDCLIAAACEKHGLILITADLDLKAKLEKENERYHGRFLLQTYPYNKDGRHEPFFRQWNETP